MDRRTILKSAALSSLGALAAKSMVSDAAAQPYLIPNAGKPEMTGKSRIETDSMGDVSVPADRLWGAQTQRSLEHFSIGKDLVPQEMVHAYAIVKKACANVNHRENRLTNQQFHLIVQVCDEILAGKHADMFPLHVWMTGSGTQFNMNVNEVIANRCSQIAGEPLGSKRPVHPNDHVNMAQSSNDTFPTAMHVAVATMVKKRLMPALDALRASVDEKAVRWKDVIKIGRTHLQDAVPTPVIGYDKASKIAHYASDHDLTLKEATLKLGYLSPSEFDRIVDPRKMLTTYVAK